SELTPWVALRSWLRARAKLTAPIGNRAMMAIMPTVRMAVAIITSISVTPPRRRWFAVMMASATSPVAHRLQPRVLAQPHLAVRVGPEVIDRVRGDLARPSVHADEERVLRPIDVAHGQDQQPGRGVA